MFCSNCGREGKEGELFCAGCGAPKGKNAHVQQNVIQQSPVQPVVSQPVNVQPEQPKKKKMPTWLVVLLIIGITFLVLIVGFIGLICFVVFSVSEYETPIYEQTDYYVYVNDVEVPTVYNLIGEYELCDTPDYEYYDGSDYITYSYCDTYFDEDIMDEYMDYLIEDYDFEYYEYNSASRTIMRRENDGSVTMVKGYLYGEYFEYYSVDAEIIKEDNDI